MRFRLPKIKKLKLKPILFIVGLLLFAVGVILVFLGVNVPSPVPTPAYQSGSLTYFWPFANYLSISGIIVSAVSLLLERKLRNAKRKK